MRRTLLLTLVCCLAGLATVPARAAVVDDDPSVAAQGAGDMRLFIRGRDNALWTRSWNGTSWSDWSSLGAVLTSGPAAMARPGGIYDVFARGTDNAMHHRAFTPATGWTPWESLGGAFITGPGATFRQGSGDIDVFGVGLDGQLYHAYFAAGATAWSGWEALGCCVVSSPSAISPVANQLEVYVRGTDNALHQKYWTPSTGWSAYVNLGGTIIAGPEATAWDANRRDIFGRSPEGPIADKPWTATAGWYGFIGLPTFVLSAPGATSIGSGNLQLFARGGSGLLSNRYAGSWTGWQPFSAVPPITPPAPPKPSEAELRLRAGLGCIPRGNRVPVHINVRKRPGRKKPRILKVLFFIDHGKHKRTDRKKPYETRIRVTYKPGSKHRVHARIYYRRPGQKHVHRKTVSKRFTMCK